MSTKQDSYRPTPASENAARTVYIADGAEPDPILSDGSSIAGPHGTLQGNLGLMVSTKAAQILGAGSTDTHQKPPGNDSQRADEPELTEPSATTRQPCAVRSVVESVFRASNRPSDRAGNGNESGERG